MILGPLNVDGGTDKETVKLVTFRAEVTTQNLKKHLDYCFNQNVTSYYQISKLNLAQ